MIFNCVGLITLCFVSLIALSSLLSSRSVSVSLSVATSNSEEDDECECECECGCDDGDVFIAFSLGVSHISQIESIAGLSYVHIEQRHFCSFFLVFPFVFVLMLFFLRFLCDDGDTDVDGNDSAENGRLLEVDL